MAVDKLPEFAKNGQKNTDNLAQEDGFQVNLKPARQWFNFLFNKLTLSINQIIDENFIKHDELIDNLTTNDSTKPVTAKQAKVLQDNKLEKTANAASATKLETARTVSFSGAATGSFSYNGSANSSCVLTLANSGVAAGSYASTIKIPQITVNAEGQLTAISQQDIRSASVTQSGVVQLADDLTTDDATKALTAKQGKLLQDNKLTIGQFGVGATIANITITTGTLDTAPTQIGSWYETWAVIHWKNQDYNSLNKPNWSQLLVGRNGSTGVLIRSSYDSVITQYNLYGEHNVVEVGNGFLKKLGTENDKNIDANAATATKLATARKINNVVFNGTQDITIADNTKFFADGFTAQVGVNEVGWNHKSGVYTEDGGGSSALIVQFLAAAGSTPSLQLRAHCANGGLFYRSSRDSVGFENAWEQLITSRVGVAPSATKLETARNIAVTGAVSGSANFDGSGNINISTSLQTGLGINQTWQDVKNNRFADTTYTNTTGFPIQLSVLIRDAGTGSPFSFFVDNIAVMDVNDIAVDQFLLFNFIVPNGSNYRISPRLNTVSKWIELR